MAKNTDSEKAKTEKKENVKKTTKTPIITLLRPIVFFDLETTGLDTKNDRIVQIGMTKVFPDFKKEIVQPTFINPTIPVKEEAFKVHGLTDEFLSKKPKFELYANVIYKFLSGCDIAGFGNNYFDIPILSEEFARCKILFPTPDMKSIDVKTLYHKFEPRDLASAYKFFLNKDFIDAHNADKDVDATVKVFFAMLGKYPELANKNTNEIADMCKLREGQVDSKGMLYIDGDGDMRYNFGKWKNSKIKDNPSYYFSFIEKNDFSEFIKLSIKNELEQNNQIKNG